MPFTMLIFLPNHFPEQSSCRAASTVKINHKTAMTIYMVLIWECFLSKVGDWSRWRLLYLRRLVAALDGD
jgi:hypothetical protein